MTSRTRITVEGTGVLLHEGPTPLQRSREFYEMKPEDRMKILSADEPVFKVYEPPRDPDPRAEAAKRLGGGPIVRERQRQTTYFLDGIRKRDVL